MAFSVSLTSADGLTLTLPYSAAMGSQLIRHQYELPQANMTLVLPTITSSTLSLVITYLTYYHSLGCDPPSIEKPIRSVDFSELVPEWDCRFVDVPYTVLFPLITAADFMDIRGLLELTTAKVASLIKGKSPGEIREMFGIAGMGGEQA